MFADFYPVCNLFLTAHNLFLTEREVCARLESSIKNCAHRINSVTCNRSVTAKHEQYQLSYRLRYKIKKESLCVRMCACACARTCACARVYYLFIFIVTFIYLYALSRVNAGFQAVTALVTE